MKFIVRMLQHDVMLVPAGGGASDAAARRQAALHLAAPAEAHRQGQCVWRGAPQDAVDQPGAGHP